MKDQYTAIIENYISAYNRFDVEAMLTDMDNDVRFENVANGEVTLATQGIAALKTQAEQAKHYFKEREQRIVSIDCQHDQAEVTIRYKGILAVDFPNGLKAGDTIELAGKSIFTFRGNKIVALKDIS